MADLLSDLTCPACGHTEQLVMPTDACVFFHECASCHTRLRPKPGDCCVFCSFGSVPCPPIQEGSADCTCAVEHEKRSAASGSERARP
ncbi:MAG: GDCCVxC domain-containing (seleno)protein [Gemmatimonas sp.]